MLNIALSVLLVSHGPFHAQPSASLAFEEAHESPSLPMELGNKGVKVLVGGRVIEETYEEFHQRLLSYSKMAGARAVIRFTFEKGLDANLAMTILERINEAGIRQLIYCEQAEKELAGGVPRKRKILAPPPLPTTYPQNPLILLQQNPCSKTK